DAHNAPSMPWPDALPCAFEAVLESTLCVPLPGLLNTIRGHRHPVGLHPDINPSSIAIALLSLRWAPPAGAPLPLLAPRDDVLHVPSLRPPSARFLQASDAGGDP